MARQGSDLTVPDGVDFGDDQHVPGSPDDLILEEHLWKALAAAEDEASRYHLRAALQRLFLE